MLEYTKNDYVTVFNYHNGYWSIGMFSGLKSFNTIEEIIRYSEFINGVTELLSILNESVISLD